jgi:hypothetical protein
MRDNHNTQPQQTKPLPTSIIRDNHPVKRGRRIHLDRRSLSSELSRYKPGDFVRAGEHPESCCDDLLTDLEPMECHSRYPG